MNTPQHIVLFPDGNRRWARQQGLPTLEGHRRGYDNLLDFSQYCKDAGGNSSDCVWVFNGKLEQIPEEVDYLMNLLEAGLMGNLQKYHHEQKYQDIGIRVKVIGQKERLPESLQKAIQKVEDATSNNKNLFLNLAVSYGGKWDILQAVKKIAQEGVPAEKIDEKLFESCLSTAGLPNPDLIIRPGGEMRLSNFVLWQAAYAELYFSPKLWPDFSKEDFDAALEEFDRRTRRFGK